MIKIPLPKLSFSLTKDFVVIYRASIIGVLLVGCLFVKFSVNQEKKQIEEKIIIATEQIEKSITYNVDYLKYQLYYATKQIKDLRASEDDKKMKNILLSFVNNINNQVDISIAWNAFSWINKNNQLSVDGVSGILKSPPDLSSRDYLKITSKIPNKLVFGKPIVGAISTRLIIPIGMGVFSDQNDYLGTLVFGLDIERIVSKIEKIMSNETFSFAVIQDQDIAFVSNNFSEENQSFISKITSDPKNKLDQSIGGRIVHSQNIFLNNGGFVYLQEIKNSPLKILVFYDQKKSYQQIFSIFLQQSFFVFLVIFTCVILFQQIYHRIVKPISQLSQLALKISEKDFSFSMSKPRGKDLLNLFNILNSVKEVVAREEILLKRLEVTNAKLSKANLAKVEFLAKSSHDIKNYIFGISGLSRIILESKNKSEILQNEELQMVETIADQSDELMRFVEDLLDTSQIESGEFSLERIEICDIGILIDRIVLLNKGLATRHGVMIKVLLESDLPKINCDIRRMKQILVNLVTNAIKYSLPKTKVEIAAKYLQKENKLYVEITDHGIGMTTDEVQILLAGRGKDIDKSDLENIDSHGIGMSIVLRLVALHQGIIEIDSKKGVGTKVKLYFNAWEGAESQKLPKRVDPSQKPRAILLVEDNPVNIRVTSKILQEAGYKIYCAENGEEALVILDQENFDLILMDGEMSVMNGYEAAEKIREGKYFKNFKHYKTIPIIALMSSSDAKVVKRAKDSGMNFHLEKSTSKTKLIDTIDAWIAGGGEK